MTVTAYVYGKLPQSLLEGRINFSTDTIKAMALSAYTVGSTKDTAQFISDVLAVATEAVGSGTSGYTSGGYTLTSKTITYTAANSWSIQRANSTAYTVGDVVRPATGNGYLYRCVVAGTSAGSAPTYTTTVGDDFADGTVTWVCEGTGVLVVDSADPSWTTGTPGSLTASYIVFYKDTGTQSTSPVMVLWDLGGAQTASNGGAFTSQLDGTEGLLVMFTS